MERTLSVSFCGGARESETIYFCLVWQRSKVHRWFGLTAVLSDSVGSLFRCFLQSIRHRKQASKGVTLVWHALIWILWKAHDEWIFTAIVIGPEEIFDHIQVVSWKCLMAKKVSPRMVYRTFWLYCLLVMSGEFRFSANNGNVLVRVLFFVLVGVLHTCTSFIGVDRVPLVLFSYS
jgi:hypothetical protein